MPGTKWEFVNSYRDNLVRWLQSTHRQCQNHGHAETFSMLDTWTLDRHGLGLHVNLAYWQRDVSKRGELPMTRYLYDGPMTRRR